jgi:F-type H+-transporting ATPase subunit delta
VKDSSVAGRYARALFIVTERRGETARALEELQAMLATAGPGTRVGALLATPLVLLSDKRKVLRDVLKDRALPTIVLYVELLLRKKRLNQLEGIVREFEALVEKQQGVRRAHVASAVPLTPGELGRLQGELERYTRAKIKLSASVEPALVGGALVRIGDRVIDRTVKSLLEAMEQRLYETSV